jgi:hypothetical protein
MPATAVQPPAKLGRPNLRKMMAAINQLIDYVHGTHIDNVQVDNTGQNKTPTVNTRRGPSGAVFRLRLNPSINGGGGFKVTAEDTSGYIEGGDVGEVDGVDTLTFDTQEFMIFDGGGGQCVIRARTCPSSCPP